MLLGIVKGSFSISVGVGRRRGSRQDTDGPLGDGQALSRPARPVDEIGVEWWRRPADRSEDNSGYLECQPIPGPGLPPELECLDGSEVVVDLSGDVALEHSDDLFLGQAFFASPLYVGAGAWVCAHAGNHDVPQRCVGLAVAAGVEP
jgi:hypothetical protein